MRHLMVMAEAYAALRESGGGGITDAWVASEFPDGRAYDRIIGITRSGTTTEILRLLARDRGRTPSTVLTGDVATPVVEFADHVLDLGFADERSVVQTLFATTALSALRAHLGADVAALAQAADGVPGEELPAAWRHGEQITFLGRGGGTVLHARPR